MAYQNISLKSIDYNKYQVDLWDDEHGHNTFEWKRTAFVPDADGDYKTLTGVPVRKTEWFSRHDETYESDVSPETALLVELYGASDEPPKWQNKFYFDIEVSMEEEDLPDPLIGNNPITSIAYFDQTTDEWGVYILDENDELTSTDSSDDYKLFICNSERDLLAKFLNKWKECNPTIVTGWNIDFFDIPYLYNRIKTVFSAATANQLSPINRVKWNPRKEKFFIAGVSCLDYITLYKQFTFTQLSSYRLDAVGEYELGYGKIEYEGTLDDLKRNDIRKFIEYNLVDVKIVKEFEDKLKLIDLSVDICHIGHVPYESIYQSSKWIEGAILCYLRRNGKRVATNKPELEDGAGDGGFAGAFVKEPVPGRYDYIYDLDLTSMYPSIIMSLNISPETKFAKVANWDFVAYNKRTVDTLSVTMFESGDTIELTCDEFAQMLEETQHSISFNGIIYRTDVAGVLPSILKDWFDLRSEYKTLMTKYGNEGDDDKYRFYKQRQLIQKVLLNSIYGVLGLKSFRFFDLDNALAVTAVGQQIIKSSSNAANYYYNKEMGSRITVSTDTGDVYLFSNVEYTIARGDTTMLVEGSSIRLDDDIVSGFLIETNMASTTA